MGVLMKVSCGSCKADWQLGIGSGLLHGNLEAIADLYPEEIKRKILLHAGQEEFPSYDFGFRPAYCARCGGIVSVPVLKLGEGDADYVGTCGECGDRVELIKEVEKTPCPVCGRKKLKSEEAGLWD